MKLVGSWCLLMLGGMLWWGKGEVRAVDLNCGWCNEQCINVLPNMGRCANTMPLTGYKCVEVKGKCTKVIVPTATPKMSWWRATSTPVKPTRSPPTPTRAKASPTPIIDGLPISVAPEPSGTKVPRPSGSEGDCGYCPDGSSRIKGDSNCDKKINLADFGWWRREYFGKSGSQNQLVTKWKSDFNCDGMVTMLDLLIWREAFIDSVWENLSKI